MAATDRPTEAQHRLAYSIKEAAGLLGMTPNQVDKLMRRGGFGDDWQSFPFTGRQWRIPRARVLKWAQADETEVPV